MSGTDSSRAPDWSPDGPVFVLVRPQLGENIGAAARAMWNFGLAGLRLVDPRDGWPNGRAAATASGATVVLDAARVFPDTAAAVADLTFVYASTARPREVTKPVFTPEAAVADMRARITAGERVGLLFGPERTGLETDDVVLAGAIVTVPTNPAFASINLAQSAVLMAYEWRRQGDATPPVRLEGEATTPAPVEEVGRLIEHLETELDAAHYFWPEHKADALRLTLRNILRRAPLTEQDVRTLRGVVRALAEGPKRHRRRRDGATPPTGDAQP
jgi:tRNA/rRNA methyltransferase